MKKKHRIRELEIEVDRREDRIANLQEKANLQRDKADWLLDLLTGYKDRVLTLENERNAARQTIARMLEKQNAASVRNRGKLGSRDPGLRPAVKKANGPTAKAR